MSIEREIVEELEMKNIIVSKINVLLYSSSNFGDMKVEVVTSNKGTLLITRDKGQFFLDFVSNDGQVTPGHLRSHMMADVFKRASWSLGDLIDCI